MRQIFLPKKGKWDEVADVLCYHHDSNESDHHQKRLSWTWAHYWLQGLRAMKASDGTTPPGLPSPTYHDRQGRKRVRFEKSLQQMKTEEGRLLKIDTGPAIKRRPGVGLTGLRGESISQAILDHFRRRYETTYIDLTLVYQLLAYGTVGLGVFPGQEGPEPWAPSLQLIPPWELRSVPANILGLHDLAGIEWHRWVPLKWLKSINGKKLRWPGKSDEQKLRSIEVAIGQRVETEAAPQPLGGMLGTASGSTQHSASQAYEPSGDPHKPFGTEEYVEIKEFFIYGGECTMKRYLLLVGEWCAADVDYTSDDWQNVLQTEADGERLVLPIMPVHVMRYQEVGSFYGRSFIDRLLPLNREVEFLIGESIDSMRKINRLRKLFIPISGGINERNLKINLKNSFVPYQPDYSAQQHKPFVPDIPDIGDAHGRLINMVGAMLDDLAGHGPLLQGDMPSRADSGIAASVVGEFQAIPVAGTGESLLRGWSGVYRAILGHIRNLFNEKLREATGSTIAAQDILIQVHRIDESILGLAFDPSTGGVKLSDFVIPDPALLGISIRSKVPRSEQVILEQLTEMVDTGKISRPEWEIGTILHGVDLPHISKLAYNNYEAAWLENVLMFGDGKTPGKSADEPPYANRFGELHPVHFMVHLEVMGTHIFQYAEDPVQKAFIEHVINYHRSELVNVPEGLMTTDVFDRPTGISPEMTQAAGMGPPGYAAADSAQPPAM